LTTKCAQNLDFLKPFINRIAIPLKQEVQPLESSFLVYFLDHC
jgi:hypothetical protein